VLERFHQVHGSRYDYARVIYAGVTQPIVIVCRDHEPFEQLAGTHLAGKGCPECGDKDRAEARRLSQPDAISRFNTIHGARFDYSRFEYTDHKTKSYIGCLESGHGFFLMSAAAHFEGKGCPRFAESFGERQVYEWLRANGFRAEREFAIYAPSEGRRRALRFDFRLMDYPMLIELMASSTTDPSNFWSISTDGGGGLLQRSTT
jgi:hypothetical protein